MKIFKNKGEKKITLLCLKEAAAFNNEKINTDHSAE